MRESGATGRIKHTRAQGTGWLGQLKPLRPCGRQHPQRTSAHSILASVQSTLGLKSYTSFVQCICRYPWKLVQALMGDLMEQVLLDFEAEAHVEVRQFFSNLLYRPLSI